MALAAAKPAITTRQGNIVPYVLTTSTTVYAGGLCMLADTGLVLAAGALASNKGCVGWFLETVASAAAGQVIYVQEGDIRVVAAGTILQSNVGDACYASDDQTVSDTQASNEPLAGYFKQYISATAAIIEVSMLAAVG
jgi:hypothetical protein